ncbi:MAG: hypothetical protein HYR55_18230 [Acidobacteria bacterium]|nr:hypothetical protein [Acidobacteriota bacterium]MBI3657385.1 hypothetical protein [Acidobacteriota bacterium]
MSLKRFAMLAMTAGLLVCMAGAALAQQPRFIVSSASFQERVSGLSEPIGDITLTASGNGTIPALTNLTVTLIPNRTVINNRPFVNGRNLTINGQPITGATIAYGATVPDGPLAGLSYQLVIAFANDVTIQAGSPGPPIVQPDRITIHGARVDVADSGVGVGGRIDALLTVSPPQAILFDNVTQVTVGVPNPTIVATFGPSTLLQCLNQTTTTSLTVREAAAPVFTSQAQEVAATDVPLAIGPQLPATNGTNLTVTFTGIPNGTILDIGNFRGDNPPGWPFNPGDPAWPIIGGSVLTNAFVFLNSSVPPDGGSATRWQSSTTRDLSITFRIQGDPDQGRVESVNFTFTWISTGQIPSQGLGCAKVAVRLTPFSTLPGHVTPIPRFNDPLLSGPDTYMCVVACICHLKFPFVTNQGGFDSGLAIANTTRDPYNTAAQKGRIFLHFYGQNPPATNPVVITGPINGGDTWVGLASNLAANFQGYMIARAEFQFCEGYAFIADQAFATIAQGYLAMVIPDPSQLGGRQPGFPLRGTVDLNSGSIVINDTFGERLVH